MKLIDTFMLLAILFSFVVVKTNAHDDGTNHSSHHHPNDVRDCEVDGGVLILLIVFALLFFVSCCVNIYQFKLRHGNVITAEVEYNSFT